MYVLDLFAGIGGFSLGLERAGMRTVGFCEINPYCRAVLAKHWPAVPCFEDIRSLDATGLAGLGRIDLICGGFPCQPWSIAGKRKGQNDERDLWPEMFRVIEQVRPAWIIGENVTGLIGLALDAVLADLESVGYSARPFVIPAAAVGAPHRRSRLWIIATNTDSNARRRVKSQRRADRRNTDASGNGAERNVGAMADTDSDAIWNNEQREARRRNNIQDGGQAESGDDGQARIVSNANGGRCEVERQQKPTGVESTSGNHADGLCEIRELDDASEDGPDSSGARLQISERTTVSRARRRQARRTTAQCNWWSTEPGVGRVAYGIPNRVDRLRALGNALVPQIAEIIGRAILQSSRDGR